MAAEGQLSFQGGGLKVFQITLPPLRARSRDAILLARVFLERSAAALRKRKLLLTPEAEEILIAYDWPGNIRELRNVMERAAILCEGGEVSGEQLPSELQVSTFVNRFVASRSEAMPALAEIEHHYIARVVAAVDGNLSHAARILGINRGTLRTKVRMPEEVSAES